MHHFILVKITEILKICLRRVPTDPKKDSFSFPETLKKEQAGAKSKVSRYRWRVIIECFVFFYFPSQPRESKTHPDTMKYGGSKPQALQINGMIHHRKQSGVKGSEVSLSFLHHLVCFNCKPQNRWGLRTISPVRCQIALKINEWGIFFPLKTWKSLLSTITIILNTHWIFTK